MSKRNYGQINNILVVCGLDKRFYEGEVNKINDLKYSDQNMSPTCLKINSYYLIHANSIRHLFNIQYA